MKKVIALLTLCLSIAGYTQSLKHPAIFVTQGERSQTLQKIATYSWAKAVDLNLHLQVDAKMFQHINNPDAILESFPRFASSSKQNTEFAAAPLTKKHNDLLALASRSAMLYYLTQNKDYAKFAADILEPYFEELSQRSIRKTTIAGNHFYDPRTTYGPLALTYDFIYNYLKSPGATVYSKALKKRVAFNNEKAQKAIRNMVGDMLQEYGKADRHGKVISNHPILTAPGALFGILCVEDDVERERLFNVFWEKGTQHQNSFKNTILPMFGKQGIWPESLSYSFMPAVTLVLNIVDRVKPEMNVTKNHRHILEGNFLFDNLRHPDRTFVRYGDSKRNLDQTKELYAYTLDLAKRRGYEDLELKALIALRQGYKGRGGRNFKASGNVFNNYQELKLFWGHDIPNSINTKIDFQKPTVIIPHAGIALQRNYVKKNNRTYGLCGIIGGAHYVHSHLTGITMELYGAGHTMAPNAGLPKQVSQRRIPLHENYFRLYAGNNTVIVNGTSHGIQEGSWKNDAYVWQNTVRNVAAEPKHLKDPIAPNFNFATQLFNDDINKAKQQRTLGILRTSNTTGYYFDLFRSKSLEKNKFHDYIYHNIGDKTTVLDAKGKALKGSKTKRYQNDVGDPVQSPGWRFFEKEKVTKPFDKAVKVEFEIKSKNRFMHLFAPGGTLREYTTALAPPTREAKNGYDKKSTQVLAIRQNGEAWDKPFISILEPTIGKESSVVSVTNLKHKNTYVGAKVTSAVNNKKIIDYILCLDNIKTIELPEHNISFTGHYGIVRIEQEANKAKVITLYVGEGTNLTYKTYNLTLKTSRRGVQTFN